ncbi:MAG: phosphohistidine phosphatase SixA [Candidatus Nanoarchaeia archaeon]
MRVYLVQHGEAEQNDPERHLTDKGVSDVEKVADQVFEKITAKKIVHSGKARAKQTADIISKRTGIPAEEAEGLRPMDDPSVWAEKIEEDVMLVGHLPHLSLLASKLINSEKKIVDFQMGCIVCLEKEEGWSVHWMVTPEIL